MNEATADSLYAELRVRGEVRVGHHLAHLLPGVRYRAKRDGLTYRQQTTRHQSGRASMWLDRQSSVVFWLEDERGWIYRPDGMP